MIQNWGKNLQLFVIHPTNPETHEDHTEEGGAKHVFCLRAVKLIFTVGLRSEQLLLQDTEEKSAVETESLHMEVDSSTT